MFGMQTEFKKKNVYRQMAVDFGGFRDISRQKTNQIVSAMKKNTFVRKKRIMQIRKSRGEFFRL